MPILNYEFKILQHLKNVEGVPEVYKYGVQGDYNWMAMDYIGYSLEHYHSVCQQKFKFEVYEDSRIFLNFRILINFFNRQCAS